MLLSRAFKIQTAKVADAKKQIAKDSKEATVESLKDTFNMLPDDTLEDVTMETFKSSASLEQRLEYLRRVEQDIKEENEETEEAKTVREALEVWCPRPTRTLHCHASAAIHTHRVSAATCLSCCLCELDCCTINGGIVLPNAW